MVSQIVKSDELACDVLQDAFVKIWTKIHKFDEKKGTIFTWMLNVARNTAIDYYRRASKMSKVEIQNATNNVSDSEAVSSSQKTDDIGIAEKLEKLDPDYRFILRYLYFEGYTQKEISDEFNIPLGTVKTRSRKALKLIKEYLVSFLIWI